MIVVGGGAIGLTSAWRCAQVGLSTAVFDPSPASGATWAAAGMLAPVTELHYGEEALLNLNLESNSMWEGFAAELEDEAGAPIGYRRTGTLSVARDTDDLAVLEDLQVFQRSLGLDVERLRSRECRRLEPMLAPGIRGGLLVAGDHQVDNRALARAVRTAAERAGVRVHRSAVAEVRADRGAVRGIVDAHGVEHHADAVVVAAGWQSGALRGLPAADVPSVRPVKGQLLHLRAREHAGWRAGEPLAQRNIRGLEAYLVPRSDGRLVVGATVEELGEDRTVTAGGVLDLLRAAWELVPAVTELEFVEAAVGLRPGSPDNAPLIGPGSLDGLVIATGHYRNGILLTPITADAVAAMVAGTPVPDAVLPFSPQRFTRRGTVGAVGGKAVGGKPVGGKPVGGTEQA